jgi:regulator of nucleoside diphosphate kinase
MSKTNRKSKPEIVLPPITVMEDEARRLNALAGSSAMLFPRVAHFLAQEMERASVVADNSDLRGVVRMGSQVRYCDDKTGEVRDVVLVYPHEADITLKRLGSYAGRGCVDRPVGWPSHRVSNAGPQQAVLEGVCN